MPALITRIRVEDVPIPVVPQEVGDIMKTVFVNCLRDSKRSKLQQHLFYLHNGFYHRFYVIEWEIVFSKMMTVFKVVQYTGKLTLRVLQSQPDLKF